MMDDYGMKEIAQHFLGMGIQNWGQGADKREAATRGYVEAAGLRFGSDEANEWLKRVLQNLPRGKFETEVEHLVDALKARQALAVPAAESE